MQALESRLQLRPESATFGVQVTVCLSASVSPVVSPAGGVLHLVREDGDAAALDCYRPFLQEGFVSVR